MFEICYENFYLIIMFIADNAGVQVILIKTFLSAINNLLVLLFDLLFFVIQKMLPFEEHTIFN